MTATLFGDCILEEEIQRRLVREHGTIRGLEVVAIDGRIRLCGEACSYAEKRRAEELAIGVEGVRQVINQIRVVPG